MYKNTHTSAQNMPYKFMISVWGGGRTALFEATQKLQHEQALVFMSSVSCYSKAEKS
jgi:hypothetical protein